MSRLYISSENIKKKIRLLSAIDFALPIKGNNDRETVNKITAFKTVFFLVFCFFVCFVLMEGMLKKKPVKICQHITSFTYPQTMDCHLSHEN